MAIVLYECGNDHGIAAAKMTCLSTRLWFVIDILLIIIVLYQIALRMRRTHKKFSRKLIILYLLLIQPISKIMHASLKHIPLNSLVNGIYSSIEYYIFLYYMDIYFRHLCFVYIVYFFSRRAWLLGDNPTVFTKK